MNGPASSIPSGCQFGQHMADQRPRFENRKLLKKKLKAGRPRKNMPRQYWVK